MKIKIFSTILALLIGIVLGALVHKHYTSNRIEREAYIYELLAIFAQKDGDVNAALNNYHIAKYLDPDNPQYNFAIGSIYNSAGLYDMADEEFKQALKEKGIIKKNKFHYALLYCNIGSISLKNNYNDTANVSFNAALELYPTLSEELPVVYNKHKSEAGIEKRIRVYERCLWGLTEMGYLKGDAP